MRTDDGFTLIELLVVVVILGVLSAIAIPSFLAQKASAYDADVQSAVRNAVASVEAFFAGNDDYPADGTDLASIGAPATPSVTLTFSRVGAGYRINADHVLLDGDNNGVPDDGDVDAWYDSAVGRVETP